MKKEVILFGVLLLTFAILPFANADVDSAYSCLNEQINSSGCSSLSFEEQIFSLLSVGQCYEEVSDNTFSNECWPGSSCNIKQTSQSLLSIENYNSSYNTTPSEDWLLEQRTIPNELQWFLEIESNEQTSCTLYHEGNVQGNEITIGLDKRISSDDLGSCFSLEEKDGYLLEVDPSCYNTEIDVSCDESFITTLLFQKEGSSTIHILDKVQSGSPDSTLTEKINSFCFSNPSSSSCNYEGSLWASEVLYYLDRDVSAFLPYLIAFSEDNPEQLPESFLYYLTGQYRTSLLTKQVRSSYWIESGDEFYDTALALLPFQHEDPIEKQNSQEWLLNNQEASGCWDNDNLRNTAFLLYSLWPRDFDIPSEPQEPGEPSDGVVCGDGVVNGTEQCDGTNLAEESCTSLDYQSGEGLDCYPEGHENECTFNTTECVPFECDEDNPCEEEGFSCSTGGQCLKDSEPSYDCDEDNPCASDEECVNNICVEKTLDCIDEGFYCMSERNCEGDIMPEYSCSGISKCCSEEISYGTCSSQDGDICNENQRCDGDTVDADSLFSGEVCCLGTCESEDPSTGDPDDEPTDASLCSNNEGNCRSSCVDGEEESNFYTCESSGEVCCLEDTSSSGGSNWFIWVLIILILLVVLGIVFRDKLKELMMKLKKKLNKKKNKSRSGRPSMFPRRTPPQTPGHPGHQRRITPPSQNKPSPQKPEPPKKKKSTSSKELDDVLNKLRSLGDKK